jgi:hypothetical protein
MNRSSNYPLKAICVLIASMALVACSESTPTPTPTTTTSTTTIIGAALNSIEGIWARCIDTGENTSRHETLAYSDAGVSEVQHSANSGSSNCGSSATLISVSDVTGAGTFTLGSAVAIPSAVESITSVTQFNSSLTAPFDIVAVKDAKLYLGDLTGFNNGTSAALQPTVLETTPFTKLPKITTLNGSFLSCIAYEDGDGSRERLITFSGTVATITSKEFNVLNCVAGVESSSETENWVITFGNEIVVNGDAPGITNAVEYDAVITTTGEAGTETEFGILGLQSNGFAIYFGDLLSPFALSIGDSDATRPTQLNKATQMTKVISVLSKPAD